MRAMWQCAKSDIEVVDGHTYSPADGRPARRLVGLFGRVRRS